MVLTLDSLIVWLIVSALAGWLAGLMYREGGLGLVGDVEAGVMGGFLNGLLVTFLLHGAAIGIVWSVIVAALGAVLGVGLLRALTQRQPAGSPRDAFRSTRAHRKETGWRFATGQPYMRKAMEPDPTRLRGLIAEPGENWWLIVRLRRSRGQP
jgi:uncharacterized membrane protein YeaQ/YmgE (transglycosylase-associated protein family)